jgi:Tol biopolymer transport system component
MIGKTLGHYQISFQLGKGGMGEVYQAKDLKLGRDVAIKVLPEEFAKDADRVARFQREAKLLASLNHPNIAAIHGLEESGGTNFLVLELVEGETLADRIKTGPVPVEESLKLALQIAEALEAAHERGVIHRDLKPANIKVTPDGKVKVLDFGLAKAFAGEQEQMNLSNSPTLSVASTQQGVILGTAAYMSPEQAKGKAVDKRSDIWSFGAVLFEMLTGEPAFPGEEVSEILASVIKGDTNLDLLPANIHPRVREVLIRSLQKEQKKRYPDIGEAEYEIEQVLADPSGVFIKPISAAKPRRKVRIGLPWAIGAVCLTVIIVGAVIWNLKPAPAPEPRPVMRFDYELPNGQQFGDLTERAIAISPDGSQFVYQTGKGLYLRSMTDSNTRLISGTGENPRKPFFSPDGQWIGYISGDGILKKTSINGGASVSLTKDTSAGFLSWSADHAIVYGTGNGRTIMRISENGGNPELLVKREGEALVAPQILPDGKNVMYTMYKDALKIVVQSLRSRERKELFTGDTAQYLPTGHLVYAVDNNLYAVPFDPGKLKVTGGPIPMVEGVLRGTAPQYAVSNSGTLIYVPETMDSAGRRTLVWADREGKEEPLPAPANHYNDYFKISPDGTRVALSIHNADGNGDIWIYDLVRGTMTRLTFDEARAGDVRWTLDGKRIIFGYAPRGRNYGIYWKSAAGTGKADQIASFPNGGIWPESLSSDGNTLLFGQYNDANTNSNIGMLSLESDRTPKLLLQEKYDEGDPEISPDGRWIAYQSNESGRWEIFVRSFPDVDSGERWQVSTSGGESPVWSPNGKELFYRSPDAIMAVSVETKPGFKPGKSKILFLNKYGGPFDIHPDGKRFLILKPPAPTGEASTTAGPRQKINIVVNWFEELKARVPVK